MSSPEALRLRQGVSAMGTTFSIALHGHDREAMEAAVAAASAEVRRLDALLSAYRPESEWSLVNREAAEHPVPVSAELFRLLSFCLEQSRLTDGAFDITVSPLKRAWGFYRGTGGAPAPGEVKTALDLVGFRHVELDEAGQAVSFDRPGVELDPGGIGKGYAVDRMVDVLRRHGFDAALVAGSNSSIYGLGAPLTGERGWRADVRDPERPATRIAEVFLTDAALCTSGTGEQFFWADGRRYSHLVDPRTGWPVENAIQLSVVAPRARDGEVWAKAFLLNGPAWATAHRPERIRILQRGWSDHSPLPLRVSPRPPL